MVSAAEAAWRSAVISAAETAAMPATGSETAISPSETAAEADATWMQVAGTRR
jgi:hypothetical protein